MLSRSLAELRTATSARPSAWRAHLDNLERRAAHLNGRRYAALRYTGPGTSLTIGLPEGHRWEGGPSRTQHGLRFTPKNPLLVFGRTPLFFFLSHFALAHLLASDKQFLFKVRQRRRLADEEVGADRARRAFPGPAARRRPRASSLCSSSITTTQLGLPRAQLFQVGAAVKKGQVLCIASKLRRCEMYLNNTSWKVISEDCPLTKMLLPDRAGLLPRSLRPG